MKLRSTFGILLKAVFALIFISLIAGCGGKDKRPIVFFGDSLTSGVGAAPQESYPKVIESKVSLTVINAGIAGDTAKDAIQRVERDVLKHNPQMVIVFLGANDVFGLGNVAAVNAHLSALGDDLGNILTAVKATDRQVFLVNTFGSSDRPAADAQSLHSALKRMNLFTDDSPEDFLAMLLAHGKMMEELARSKSVGFIDNVWRGVINVEGNMSPDGIHPNADGYKVMAENIFAQIKSHL